MSRWRPRIIPVLLLKDQGLVKTVKFDNPQYVGDPINAAKIFNDSEVDELIIVDISARRENRRPNFDKISELTTECFMPLCYGGGLDYIEDAQKLVTLGVEKVSFNTATIHKPEVVKEASKIFGASSVVAAIDVKKTFWGKYEVHVRAGRENTGKNPVDHAKYVEDLGAGEIFLTSIDKEGGQKGYDLALIEAVTKAVRIPVVAHGGAGQLQDMKAAIDKGASAAAAGSLFVYHGRLNGILINYPTQRQLKDLFQTS